MSKRSQKSLMGNTLWLMTSRLSSAAVQFACVPLYIRAFGTENYGLVVLALSLNMFVAMFTVGLPMGIVKYVSEWLGRGDYARLYASMSSASTVSLMAGLGASLAMAGLAASAHLIFRLTPDQEMILRRLIYISAVSCSLYFFSNMMEQLLTGAEEIAWLAWMNIARQVLALALAAVVYVWPSLVSVEEFFFLQSVVIVHLFLPLNVIRWGQYASIRKTLWPGWNPSDFRPLLRFSLLLFVLGFSQLCFRQLRPVIIGASLDSPASSLTEYQVVSRFGDFMVMLSMVVVTVLIPRLSREISLGNWSFAHAVIWSGTKLTWAVWGLAVTIVTTGSADLLRLYVGPEYAASADWLKVLMVAVSINLYLGPIAAVVVASGRVRVLSYCSAVSVPVALSVAWILTPMLRSGIGGVVLATLLYNALQLAAYHLWVLPKELNLGGASLLLRLYLPPAAVGATAYFAVGHVQAYLAEAGALARLATGSVACAALYVLLCLTFYITPREVLPMIAIIRRSTSAPSEGNTTARQMVNP